MQPATQQRVGAVALLTTVALLTGCTSASQPSASPSRSAPTATSAPGVGLSSWVTMTDKRTGLIFRFPPQSVPYDFSAGYSDGTRQVGTRYFARDWSAETNLDAAINLIAYTYTGSRSVDPRTELRDGIRALRKAGNTQVRLADVRAAQVQGLDATYATFTYLTKTSHHMRSEMVRVSADGWGLAVDVSYDGDWDPVPAAVGRQLRALLSKVLRGVDFSTAGAGPATTT